MNGSSQTKIGTYGFRFANPSHLALCNLFAVGRDDVRDTSYHWDGLTRKDGPLLLFQYTLNGEGIFESNDKTYRVQAGKAIMIEIPSNHRYYFPKDGERWTFLFILMRPDLILPNWKEAKQKMGEVPYLPLRSRPIRLLQDIWEEANQGKIVDLHTASSYVYQFVSELCRFASTPNEDRREWPETIRRAAQYIETHYGNMISLEALSEKLGLSKYHFLRVFSATTGMTPNEYLNRVRIDRATQLLLETNWNLEKIAQQVGYSSGSYFIKVFRKMTGRTPGSIRSGTGRLTYNRFYFD